MKLKDFDFKLPKELIAKAPKTPRDQARLLKLDRTTGAISHHIFYDITGFLRPGDLLLLNDSKVFPARLFGRKKNSGGKVEILLERRISDSVWEAVGKNLKIDTIIQFSYLLEAKVLGRKDQVFNLKFNMGGNLFWKEIEKIGHTPLPPYLNRQDNSLDKSDYQTIYAKNVGSVAAPTAGMHFTKDLLKKIEAKGVNIAKLTLHVGLGTWQPVKTEEIEDHIIHSELFEIPKETIAKILETKNNGGRIIAVGTTTTRVLEHIARKKIETKKYSGETNIYIYPGFKFKLIDGLITNFHLPKSSLLLLVSAFAGKENIDKAYSEAISQKYSFYSYGDAMLII